MKKPSYIIASAIALAVAGLAVVCVNIARAAEGSVSESLQRIQWEIPADRAQAFFEKSTSVNGETFKSPWTEVSWQTGAQKSVTVNGTTYTYAQIKAVIIAIAEQEKAEQAAP